MAGSAARIRVDGQPALAISSKRLREISDKDASSPTAFPEKIAALPP
jgi:hypothetical protein